MHAGAGKGIDVDRHRLTGVHVGQLRFLVVGGDIDRLQRHDRHQLRARLHILPDPQRARADRAVHRRGDRGVARRSAPPDAALACCCASMARACVSCAPSTSICFCVTPPARRCRAPARPAALDLGGGLLGVLHGARAGPRRAGVALVILVGEGQRRPGRRRRWRAPAATASCCSLDLLRQVVDRRLLRRPRSPARRRRAVR